MEKSPSKSNAHFVSNFQTRLSDIIADHDYNKKQDGVGYRSCYGALNSSPAVQGRSIREIEEQMSSLRKENFNLKLRLYFIEESIPGYNQHHNSSDGREVLLKQIIDLKVESEVLRKEVQEKQDLLKEAGQVIDYMEKMQKDTANKAEEAFGELNDKIQYLEMERDVEKTNTSKDIVLTENKNEESTGIYYAEKVKELQDALEKSEEKLIDFQCQIDKLDSILCQRDLTIEDLETRIKEVVAHNIELSKSVEERNSNIVDIQRYVIGLQSANDGLKEDNHCLVESLKNAQETFRTEMCNIKSCERQMREQQNALSQMQSTILIKTAKTTRLLECIQDYEKTVAKMKYEKNLAKRENRFFRAIISKLRSNSECFTIEREEIFEKIGNDNEHGDLHPAELNNVYLGDEYCDFKAHGDFHCDIKLKKKLSLNFCKNETQTYFHKRDALRDLDKILVEEKLKELPPCDLVVDYLEDCHTNFDCTDLPIRYTIGDGQIFTLNTSRANSCSSLQGNLSTTSMTIDESKSREEDFLEEPKRSRFAPSGGTRCICSKFGNIR